MSGTTRLLASESTGDRDFHLDVGSVLHRTVTIWSRNVLPFSVFGLLVDSPVLLALAALAISGRPRPTLQAVLVLVSFVLTLLLTAGVTYGVFHGLRGRRADVADVLWVGVARIGMVWMTSMLTALGLILGCGAAVIPGLVVLAQWWVAVPVAVIEGRSPTGSISRSVALTEGNRWRIFAIALVVLVVERAAGMVIDAGLAVLSGARGAAGGAQLQAWAEALRQLAFIPIQALAAVTPSIVYHDLRVGKEGVDVEELLKVFE